MSTYRVEDPLHPVACGWPSYLQRCQSGGIGCTVAVPASWMLVPIIWGPIVWAHKSWVCSATLENFCVLNGFQPILLMDLIWPLGFDQVQQVLILFNWWFLVSEFWRPIFWFAMESSQLHWSSFPLFIADFIISLSMYRLYCVIMYYIQMFF